MMGWVYFIQCNGPTGPVKIGWSANVNRRQSDLQMSTPYDLALIGKHYGERSLEAELHALFADHSIRGEWFHPHPDILAAAEQLPGRTGMSLDGHKLLMTILLSKFYIQLGLPGYWPRDERRTSQIILTALGQRTDREGQIDEDLTRAKLAHEGILVTPSVVWFANQSLAMANRLKHTSWPENWGEALLNVEGATRGTRALYFKSQGKHRAVGVPSNWVATLCNDIEKAKMTS